MTLGLVVGCAGDPRLQRARVVDAVTEPRSHRWAVAVLEPARRAADTAHVSVWIGEGSATPPRARARIAVPAHVRHGFEARLLGFGRHDPVLELAGYAVPETSASAHRLRWLALPEDAEPIVLAQLPADLVRENGVPATFARGDRRVTWVRVEFRDSILVQSERDRSARLVAVLDVANARLISAVDSAAAGAGPVR